MVLVEVLGALRVSVGGRTAVLRGPMQGAVLARLVSAGGEVVSVDRLIEDLWQGEPPPKASGALQAHISYLRRSLEPERSPRAPARILVSQAPGYALRLPVSSVDAWHFDQLMATATATADPAARHRTLDAALALWRGPAYAPYSDTVWSAAEIARLTDLRRTAVEQRAEAALSLGRPDEAAASLRRLVDEYPEREAAVRLLALAQYRLGRQLEALATLRALRATLNTEFGVDPSPPLRDLEAAILAHDPSLTLPLPSPPPPAIDATANSYPGRVTSAHLAESGTGTAGSATSSAPVGYPGQRAALLAAANEAAIGHGRLVWLEGEAGAGKTTLVRTVTEHLAATAWRVVIGHCPEVDGAPAAWAWMELLDELGGGNADLAAHPTPFGLARAVADCLTTADPAEAVPVVVVLEDAHRADSATLQILRQVVAWSARLPVLFVVTMRGSEAGEEVRGTSAALAAATAGRLELTGLDAAAVRVVAEAAGLHGIDDGTVELVRDRTGGNPLFVAELAKLAAAEGDLLAVPAGARDVLLRRIARLPAAAARLLRLLAVWGGGADFDSLLELSGEDEETLVDLVDTAVVSGLLRIERSGRIRFGHALTRDAVYAGIPALRRARMHWTALAVAERASAPDLDALAHHALVGANSANALQALGYARAAALQAGARREFPDAEPLWRAVLELYVLAGYLTALPPALTPADHHRTAGETVLTAGLVDRHRVAGETVSTAAPVPGSGGDSGPSWLPAGLESEAVAGILESMCALVNALAYRGDDSAARGLREQALAVAERLAAARPGVGDPMAAALGSWRSPLIWGTRDKRLPDERMVRALAAALDRPLPPATRVRLLITTVFEVEGDDDPLAFAASAEALATARALGDAELLCAALNARAFLALGPDLWDEREALTTELRSLAGAAGLVEFQAVAHFLGCLIACGANDLARARDEAERGLECATGGQLRQLLTVLSTFSAVLAILRGDLAAAERIYAECSADMVASGTANGAELMIAAAMVLGWARGDLSELVEPMGRFHAAAPGVLVHPYVVALLDAGENDRARAVFEQAGPIKRDHYWSVMVVFRARAALRLNDLDGMRDCYRDMLPRAGTMAGLDTGSVVYGPMDTILAELADALGDPVAAAAHRLQAAQLNARIADQLAALPA
ncbi:BTAD domain-containing putative transcriptional regulator [Nocardia yamanashiensis]|uniref:BTAD domain-containing putative transcriptional regulator n=1 Tax=Nocardia yamanashiensis TaxID=209247 RepID=UPI0022B81E83|nr:BTAD domain-containing putative transcriptional regulator [Nocardia yamanashiensis]